MPVRCLLLPTILLLTGSLLCVADQVTLTTGETLSGTIVERTGQILTLQHTVLGRLTIAAENIAGVDGSETNPPITPAEETVSETPEPSPEMPHFFQGWGTRLEIGFSGSDGNSETTSMRVGVRSTKKNDHERWLLKSSYHHATSKDQTTRNEFNLDLTRDRFVLDSDWFTFGQVIYDYDQFEAWDHRVSAFGGIGYEIVDNERIKVTGRTGGGLTRQFGADDVLRPEGLISAIVGRYKLTDNQTLSSSITLYPDLIDSERHRLISKLEWLIKINRADGVNLKLGLEDEYESQTEGGTQHNDLKYYGNIVIDF